MRRGIIFRRKLDIFHHHNIRRQCSSQSRIFNSIYSQIEAPANNLSDFTLKNAQSLGNLSALVDGERNNQVTYSQLYSTSRRVGAGLLDAGYGVGSRVATILPNSMEFAEILFGTVGVGSALVPISPLLGSGEIERILHLSSPSILFTSTELQGKVAEACKELKVQPLILCLDQLEGNSSYSRFIQRDEAEYEARKDFDPKETLAVLPFSSGTTGMPKGVMLSHWNLVSGLMAINNRDSGCAIDPYTPDLAYEQPTLLSVIPNYHIFGLTCNVIQPLSVGAKTILLPKFDPARFVTCLANYKPHVLNIVPPLLSFIALNPNITREEHLSGVHTIGCGGAPIPKKVLDAISNKLQGQEVAIKEGYGMTECPLVSRTKVFTPGSVGKLLNNFKAKVVDPETGELMGRNQPGELCLHHDMVMMGYLDNPEETNQTLRDGWLHTGDIVYIDEEDDIYIVDRLKDMIKVKGYQVSPTELEREIQKMPAVLEVAVIGVPDEKTGEAPKAFIVAREQGTLTGEMVNQFIEQLQIAKYKELTGGVAFLDQLPKSPTGKVLRKELKKMN